MNKQSTLEKLKAKNEVLSARLGEAEETLRAIRNQEIDALVVEGPDGQKVFTLEGADHVYRIFVETMSEGALTVTPDGTILHCNKGLSEMLQKPVKRIIGKSFSEVFVSQDLPALQQMIRTCTPEGCRGEYLLSTDDGQQMPVAISARSMTVDPKALCVVITDLSEQKRIQKALETETERRKKAIRKIAQSRVVILKTLESIADGFISLDKNWRFTYANKKARQLFQKTLPQLKGKNIWKDVAPKEIGKDVRDKLQRAMKEQTPLSIESILPFLQKWIEIRSYPSRDGLWVYFSDITERKEVERERTQLATAVENAAEGIVILNSDFVVRYINPAFSQMTGYQAGEVLGKDMKMLRPDVKPDTFYKDVRDAAKTHKVLTGALPLQRKDGTVCPTRSSLSSVKDGSGAIVNYVVLSYDMTEQIRLEQQIINTQKLEALGTLAGGIAHDFNNILAGIMGFVEMVQEDLPPESPEHQRLALVLKGAQRGRDLVKRILTFSRKEEPAQIPVVLSNVVEESLNLVRPTFPSTIRISTKNSAKHDLVFADPGQMHQVLMNLCTNAVHAMRENGGSLEIEVAGASLSSHEQPPCPDMKPGNYVTLTVSDTGCGMPPEILKRIFDPFFTTKTQAEGTGLGLSVVHGIILNHGGYVSVESKQGEGSTFRIYLPGMDDGPSSEGCESSTNLTFLPGAPDKLDHNQNNKEKQIESQKE